MPGVRQGVEDRDGADRLYAIALACRKERGPAPRAGTEIAVRMIG